VTRLRNIRVTEDVKALVPELPVRRQPCFELGHPVRIDLVNALLGSLAHEHQVRVPQHAQVLGCRRLGQPEVKGR